MSTFNTAPAFAYAHPASLYVLLRLLGHPAADITQARILEIGCGPAHRLLALAALLPEATVVGTDPDAKALALARTHAAALELDHLTLHQHSHATAPAALAGQFDYIVVQGVFDLIDDDDRRALLSGIKARLAPRGVAVIDYATYPGQHLQDPTRRLLEFAVTNDTPSAERVATAADVLEFIGKTSMDIDKSVYGAVLSMHAEQLQRELAENPHAEDTAIIRSAFSTALRPLYFHQFAALCAAADLQFFYEADFANTLPGGMDASLMSSIRVMSGGNTERREQYVDFLSNRTQRQSLVTHRGVKSALQVNPEQLRRFYLRTRARPLERDDPDGQGDAMLPTVYKTPDGREYTMPDAATSAALYALCYAAPDALSWGEILSAIRGILGIEGLNDKQSEALVEDIMGFYGNSTQLVQLVSWRPPLPQKVAPTPQVFPVALAVLNDGPLVPTLWGEAVQVPPLVKLLMPHLNGENTLDDLAMVLRGWVEEGYIQLNQDVDLDDVLQRQLLALLRWLHEHALLMQ